MHYSSGAKRFVFLSRLSRMCTQAMCASEIIRNKCSTNLVIDKMRLKPPRTRRRIIIFIELINYHRNGSERMGSVWEFHFENGKWKPTKMDAAKTTLIDVRCVGTESQHWWLTHFSNDDPESKPKRTRKVYLYISLAVMQSILFASLIDLIFAISIWSNDVHDGAHRHRLHAINICTDGAIRETNARDHTKWYFLFSIWRIFDRRCWCLYHQQMLSPFRVAPLWEVSSEKNIFFIPAAYKGIK